jgi:FkbM family methyltransferase
MSASSDVEAVYKTCLVYEKDVSVDAKARVLSGSFNPEGTVYEKAVLERTFELLSQTGKDRPRFADAGANTGSFTLLAKFMNLEVHSFEPNPGVCELLRSNCRLNGVQAQIYQCALSDRAETRTLNHPSTRWSGLGTLRNEKYDSRVDVQTITLDSLGLDFDLMKIDVEGWEVIMLRGALDTLRRCHPVLVIEINACPLDELYALLREVGYDSFENFGEIDMIARKTV